MARTQTLVQLSEELLALLDARAAREGLSRSELIRLLLWGSLRSELEDARDRAIVAGYTREPQTAEELALAEQSARTMIAAEPWEKPDG